MQILKKQLNAQCINAVSSAQAKFISMSAACQTVTHHKHININTLAHCYDGMQPLSANTVALGVGAMPYAKGPTDKEMTFRHLFELGPHQLYPGTVTCNHISIHVSGHTKAGQSC